MDVRPRHYRSGVLLTKLGSPRWDSRKRGTGRSQTLNCPRRSHPWRQDRGCATTQGPMERVWLPHSSGDLPCGVHRDRKRNACPDGPPGCGNVGLPAPIGSKSEPSLREPIPHSVAWRFVHHPRIFRAFPFRQIGYQNVISAIDRSRSRDRKQSTVEISNVKSRHRSKSSAFLAAKLQENRFQRDAFNDKTVLLFKWVRKSYVTNREVYVFLFNDIHKLAKVFQYVPTCRYFLISIHITCTLRTISKFH